MINRRDVVVAVVSVCTTLGAVVFAQSRKPIMQSSVFEWTSVEAKPTKTGARRDFFDAPTATLDQLECHVTTINPGEAPHAPHQHADEELIIVKEGTLEAMQNGVTKQGPGSIIFEASTSCTACATWGRQPRLTTSSSGFRPG
jgi:hypothetical protein